MNNEKRSERLSVAQNFNHYETEKEVGGGDTGEGQFCGEGGAGSGPPPPSNPWDATLQSSSATRPPLSHGCVCDVSESVSLLGGRRLGVFLCLPPCMAALTVLGNFIPRCVCDPEQ